MGKRYYKKISLDSLERLKVYFKLNLKRTPVYEIKIGNKEKFLKKNTNPNRYLPGSIFSFYISLFIFNLIFILIKNDKTYYFLIAYISSLILYFVFSDSFYIGYLSPSKNNFFPLIQSISLSLSNIFSFLFFLEFFKNK